jgi:Flp pilus assembly protein TadB
MAAETQAPEYKESINPGASRTSQPAMPATQARAGVTGHNVRYVLIAGLAGVIVAFVIVYLVFV